MNISINLPLIFSIEEVFLATVHVSAVEAVINRVVTLGSDCPLDYLQITNLPEVRVCHSQMGDILEVQNIDCGCDVDIVEYHGTLSAFWFPEEHSELQVC